MRAETEQVIERLRTFQWFANAGKYSGSEFEPVQTKEKGLQGFTGKEWYNFTVPFSNRFQGRLLKAFGHPDKYRHICLEVCGTITDAFVEELDEVIARHLTVNSDQVEKAKGALRLHVAGMLAEAEFSNVTQPFFYLPVVLRIYESGHIPCGWTGVPAKYNWNGTALSQLGPGKIRIF